MKYLAIDYGTKRIGLACAERDAMMASPLAAMNAGPSVVEELRKLISREQVTHIVVGLPLDMNGTEGPWCRRVRTFASQLQSQTGLPVELIDERMTTAEARRTSVKKGQPVDSIAAGILLDHVLQRRVPDEP